MWKVTLIFRDQERTKQVYRSVARFEVHTYRFIELVYVSGDSEQINLDDVFSFSAEAA